MTSLETVLLDNELCPCQHCLPGKLTEFAFHEVARHLAQPPSFRFRNAGARKIETFVRCLHIPFWYGQDTVPIFGGTVQYTMTTNTC